MLLGLGIGGVRFYRSGVWLRWLPTSALFWMDPASTGATDELIVRQGNNLLSPEESARLIARTVALTTFIRTPRPVSNTFDLDLTLSTKYGLSGYGISSRAPNIQLDGVALDNNHVMMRQSSTGYTYHLDEPLSVGTHIVTGDIVVMVDLHTSSLTSVGGPISVPLQFRHEVVVEDRPLNAYVVDRYDDEIIDTIRKGCFLSICPVTSSSCELHFCVTHATLWMAGTLEARLAGQENPIVRLEFVQTPIMGKSTNGIVFSLPADVASDDAIFDVRFTPDPQAAFDENFREHFAGTLEWHGLTIPGPDMPMTGMDCPYCDPPFDRSPDVIRAWGPVE